MLRCQDVKYHAENPRLVRGSFGTARHVSNGSLRSVGGVTHGVSHQNGPVEVRLIALRTLAGTLLRCGHLRLTHSIRRGVGSGRWADGDEGRTVAGPNVIRIGNGDGCANNCAGGENDLDLKHLSISQVGPSAMDDVILEMPCCAHQRKYRLRITSIAANYVTLSADHLSITAAGALTALDLRCSRRRLPSVVVNCPAGR